MPKKRKSIRHDLQYYGDQAADLLEANRERNKMFAAMDDMAHNRLTLPTALTSIEGFHQVTPTEPSDSLKTANRILVTVEPKITYHPLDSTPESREDANVIEKALMWHYKRAQRRSVGNITRDMNMSALRYDEICAQVVYLPWQRKLNGQKKGKEWDAGGDFAVLVSKPSNVYTRRNSYSGVTAVFLCTQMTPDEIIELWGDKAEQIISRYAETTPEGSQVVNDWPDYVWYYDWMDKTDRVVWLSFGEISDDTSNINTENVIIKAPHGLPFIPWSCAAGGSAIDTEPQHQRNPLLASVYQSDSWFTMAVLESLMMTESIKTAAFPLLEMTTLDGKPMPVDYTVFGGVIAHQPQESVSPITKPQIDPRLRELTDRTQARIGSSTLPSILNNPSFGAGAAFSTVNAQLRAASNSLDPFRTLTEYALSEVFSLMLKWLIFTGDPLYAYDLADRKKTTYGNQIMVDPKTIAPDDIYIDVKLSATLPLDKLSEINAVVQIMNMFGISKERALEMLDVTDADTMIEEGVQEQLTNAEIAKALKVIGAEGDAQAQAILAQVQMQIQQQQQAAQAAAAQAQQQAMAQSAANVPPGQENMVQQMAPGGMQGMAFDPSMGGTPPMQGAPGALAREQMNGRTNGGEQLAGM